MANCAHKAARGLTLQDLSQIDPANHPTQPPPLLSVANLMNYVQHESITWHFGLAYTMLMLQTIDFLRPELFSST